MQVNSINPIPSVPGSSMNKVEKSGTTFADVMNEALNQVNNLQIESSKMTDSFINGESDNIHSVIMAGAKADLALQMTLQVRNKVMDAYKEVMNMQI
ncbi:MAG: flagellar hook-basal body complex protein FliE [Clostridia bacterium]|nr:flagellar hook-basal body complex protein FliE [Clostridia bacterium]